MNFNWRLNCWKRKDTNCHFHCIIKFTKILTFCGKIASTINANEDKQHHTQLCWVTDGWYKIQKSGTWILKKNVDFHWCKCIYKMFSAYQWNFKYHQYELIIISFPPTLRNNQTGKLLLKWSMTLFKYQAAFQLLFKLQTSFHVLKGCQHQNSVLNRNYLKYVSRYRWIILSCQNASMYSKILVA